MTDIVFFIAVWFSGFALGGAWLLSTDWRIYRKLNEQRRAAISAFMATEPHPGSLTAHAMFSALTKDPSP